MKEILIVSGKGGTGKTSIVASFAQLSKNTIFCDCDVDASNLHLLLNPTVEKTTQFYAGWQVGIDLEKCTKCGKCYSLCRFKAISFKNNFPELISGLCEGCGVCADYCPENAIKLKPRHCGLWHKSTTNYGALFHAELFPGEENSGRLIAELRKATKEEAKQQNSDYILLDGPPGIGCPVISSMSGVDLVVIVTEPTLSGMHDCQRVAQLAKQFGIPVQLIINKWDLNPKISNDISQFCEDNKIKELGRITYDSIFPQALRAGKTVLNYENSMPANEIKNIWTKILETFTL